MSEKVDLCIRGGTIVDGTGAPRRTGDVAIAGGRIAALGSDLDVSADRELDAAGCVVAPGFVDIHTHYDAQVFWDRMLSCSPWHGVTSVVVGNCGFGVAPTHAEHRDLILRTLENVEGMSLDALRSGLGDWPFETFPEYLDALERLGPAINVGALVGHTPIRTYVMGEESVEREATDDEVARMRALVEDALRAGAIGFATSKSPTHVGYDGNPVPSRAAHLDEIEALCDALSGSEHAAIEVTVGPGFFLPEFERIARRVRRPISWTALLGGMLGPDGHRGVLEQCRKLQEEGLPVIPQVSCRPLMFEFQMKAPFPLEAMSVMKEVSKADREGKRRIYADPAFRERLRDRIDGGGMRDRFHSMAISAYDPDPRLVERTLAEVGAERGIHPVDLALDLSLDTDLEARFRMAVLNQDDDVVAELVAHPASMLGLSDAGAHASQLCDAGAPTTLLGKWVREREVLSLEEGVRQLTSQPADVFGITDRGRLAEGQAADVTVFDPETVDCGPVRRVHDFPAGADRLVADATGIRAVLVNGVSIREDGRDVVDPDGPLPGRVLRGGQAR